MPTGKLWLTYAWKDNNDQDVDFIIQELEARGLDVGFDRARLLTGRRLWQQIDSCISDPELNSWAILLTRNSLESEPCQEELAYALDRALREKGGEFPIIGVFPEPMDRKLIPSAIATRLYVSLEDNDWADRIKAATQNAFPTRSSTNIEPYKLVFHEFKGKPVLEIWPRTGTWAPFFVGVPEAEGSLLSSVLPGPKGTVTGTAMVTSSNFTANGYRILSMQNEVTASRPAHVFLNEIPSKLLFGAKVDGKEVVFHLTRNVSGVLS
ncbi:toll/interleukin-1 receptor domain-containing protein [Roseibium aggregatum]|uniref:toll/interleukin-1 receptor domain-containing protein n=1 Tax=Roseibium aggregatum TaxID=187304 RepID=UPI001E40C7EE|nr:toll/interleukin-1 receptor domain-containing protein [Roseibium aggregatum]